MTCAATATLFDDEATEHGLREEDGATDFEAIAKLGLWVLCGGESRA